MVKVFWENIRGYCTCTCCNIILMVSHGTLALYHCNVTIICIINFILITIQRNPLTTRTYSSFPVPQNLQSWELTTFQNKQFISSHPEITVQRTHLPPPEPTVHLQSPQAYGPGATALSPLVSRNLPPQQLKITRECRSSNIIFYHQIILDLPISVVLQITVCCFT